MYEGGKTVQRELVQRRHQEFSEDDLVAFLQSNKEFIIKSIRSLNLVDIEGILSRVCQIVLQDNSARREDLGTRAEGMETLGKIFQGAKLQNEDEITESDTALSLDNKEYSNYANSPDISPYTHYSGNREKVWVALFIMR